LFPLISFAPQKPTFVDADIIPVALVPLYEIQRAWLPPLRTCPKIRRATPRYGLATTSAMYSRTLAYGTDPDRQAEFQADMEATAGHIEQESMAQFAKSYALGPARVQL